MLAKVLSCTLYGLEGYIIEVEVDISSGMPSFTIVGLPDTAVQESKERVRSAIKNSGFDFPIRRITVNLAPANLKKVGPAFDLPIAIGILISSGQLRSNLEKTLFLGEVSLDGTIRHTNGILTMVAVAKKEGMTTVYVPFEDSKEAALVNGIKIIPCISLSQLVAHLYGNIEISPALNTDVEQEDENYSFDLNQIKGQEHAKRALEVAAAGAHNILMSGPPGTGKTMLARSLPSILPRLSFEESIEVTKIYSACGLLGNHRPLITNRPFRSPHYTISHAGLVGGGHSPKPGEISLSHFGVLFLDEIPEFNRTALESLRQPLEDKVVTISRSQGSVTFPANFMLVAAMNPCPCGYYGDNVKECKCSFSEIIRYQKRISGPLLDRFDIFVELPRVDSDKLMDNSISESSNMVRERVTKARNIQKDRFRDTSIHVNSEMTPSQIKQFCKLEKQAQDLLNIALRQMKLSARAYHKVLKLSRTIADLDGADMIHVPHLAEALQYRHRQPE